MTPIVKVRTYSNDDFNGVDALWREAFPDDPPWNRAKVAIPAKLAVQPELFVVAVRENQVIGSAMAGYDGHRGWLYAVSVLKEYQHRGVGRALVSEMERRLIALGCWKINLQVRAANQAVANFYAKLGYATEARISMGKRIIDPTDKPHAGSMRDAKSDIETIRDEYRPKPRITTLFVGESAPASGKFFYKIDSLTSHMRKALDLEAQDFAQFLETFKARGWFLDDLVKEPVNKVAKKSERRALCRAARDDLAGRIREYRPDAVVCLLRCIEKMVGDATREAAPNAKFYGVPFPGNGNLPKFVAEMQRIIPLLPRLPEP